jgi:hypothetical protein
MENGDGGVAGLWFKIPAQPCSATDTRQSDTTLHVQVMPMSLRIPHESDRTVVQSRYVLHFNAVLGAINSFIGYTSGFHYCNSIATLAETKAKLESGF